MQMAFKKVWERTAAVVASAALVAACMLVVSPPQAHASGVAWNGNVTVVAYANDWTAYVPVDENDTRTDPDQTIDVTMTFANTLDSSIDATAAESYLQTHTSIAGYVLDGTTSSTYARDISGVTVNNSAKTIHFTIEPNYAGSMTANYNSELLITADSDATTGNSAIASAMGNASVETLITSGLAIEKTASSAGSSTFHITGLPACRQMNFVLFSLVIGSSAYPIYTNGTSANGNGLTIHSHNFYDTTNATAASYATKLQTAASSATSAYTLTATSNGYFTITGTGAENVIVNVYNGNYLNSGHLAVGTTTESIITDPDDPRA